MKYLKIGKFLKPHGLKGELKAVFYVDRLDDIRAFSGFYVDVNSSKKAVKEFKIENIKELPAGPVVKINMSFSIEDAEEFRGLDIFVNEEELPPLKEGEFYLKDILGLLFYIGDEKVGKIFNFVDTGAHYIILVQTDGDRTLAVPLKDDFIEDVNIREGKIIGKEKVRELF